MRIFLLNPFIVPLEPRSAVPFLWNIIWSPCVPTKVGFFCLGSIVWEGSNPGSTQKEGKTNY